MDKKSSYKKNHVEILAPAGSYEAMEAAVLGGCDAVYAAGMRFGARAFAKNFSMEELVSAINYLHLRGKKLYLTMNTLIKEEEMDGELFNTLKFLYEEGLDAVIVQDMGLMKFIHENFPQLPIHASTQTSLMSAYGANLLSRYGVNRIIPARECSLSDIKLLRKNTDMEIECFVHGALCFCYSGQCLLSSMNGGRSGNRGRCAQPCRLPYSFNNKGYNYPLSPKDMCTLHILPDLIEAGIDSFKIEGRMKNKEYCLITAFLYKKYSEEYYSHGREYYMNSFLNENGDRRGEFLSDLNDLADIFNRGGFTGGYYGTLRIPQMMSDRRPNHFGSPVGAVTDCHIEGEKRKNKGDTKKTKSCFKITLLPSSDIRKDDVLEIRDSKENTILLLNGSMDFKEGKGTDFSPYGLKREEAEKIRALLKREGSLKLYRLRNHALFNRLNENFLKESVRNKKTPFKMKYPFLWGIPVKAYLSGRAGEVLSLRLEGGESVESVEVSTEQILLPADNEGFFVERLSEQINKTGEYPFSIELSADALEKDCFIPMSLFNRLRRDAMEGLAKKIEDSFKRSFEGRETLPISAVINDKKAEGIPKTPSVKPVISCSVISTAQAEKVIELAKNSSERKFELILNGSVCPPGQILDMLRKIGEVKSMAEEKFLNIFPEIYLSMPAVFPPRVQRVWEKGFLIEGDGYVFKEELRLLSGIFVRTLDEAGYIREKFPDVEIRAEFGLYRWNEMAGRVYEENGISYNTISPELSADDTKKLDLSKSYLPVYGNICLMASEQCLIKNNGGCVNDEAVPSKKRLIKDGDSIFYNLKNKEGKNFSLINVCAYCYNLIFSEAMENRDMIDSGLYGLRFDFYEESPDRIDSYIKGFD